MPKVELPFEALLEATGQLDTVQLETLAQRLSEVRRFQKKQIFQAEAEQTKKDYEELSLSQAEWKRYDELIDLRRAGPLSDSAEREWRELSRRSEELSVARVALLSEFARRHGLALAEVTRRLKIKAREAVVI